MKTFLICHRGSLGDFILTWPALYRLKRKLSQYRFLGFGRSEYMRLARRFGLIDDCRDMESKAVYDFLNGKSFPQGMERPDGAALWLTDCDSAASLLRETAQLPVVTIKPFPAIAYHVARYYCDMVNRHFPISVPDDLTFSLPVPDSGEDYALIHPGSGGVDKNYTPVLYCKIAGLLRRKFRKVWFVLGPVELERNEEREYGSETVCKPRTVNELADLLIGASLYIGNDSGASHLAAILGTPAITLYKSTDPKIWGTLGKMAWHIIGGDETEIVRRVRDCLDAIILE